MKTRLLKIGFPVLFSLSLFIFAIFPFVAKAQPPRGLLPENVIVAEPVNGVTVGPGKKLWVFTFPAKGGKKGPPNKPSDDGPTCPGPCEDINDTNAGFSILGFKIPSGLDININDSSVPGDIQGLAEQAINASFNTWTAVEGTDFGLNVESSGGADRPAEDGIHSVGFVKIVPKNTLAATWIWATDGIVTDVDIFFNLFHKWGILECGAGKFDVEDICTHEVGHLIGLAHESDECKMATMYPSASKGEIKKRTLTHGDIAGAKEVSP